MFKKLLPYLLIFIGLWYLPEIFSFLRSFSSDLYNQSAQKVVYKVEVKVVNPLPLLPQKFSVLRTGIPQLWIELDGVEKPFVRGGLTGGNGNVVLLDIPPGNYFMRVAQKPDKTDQEITRLELENYSVLSDSELISTSLDRINVTKDVYVVAIKSENN